MAKAVASAQSTGDAQGVASALAQAYSQGEHVHLPFGGIALVSNEAIGHHLCLLLSSLDSKFHWILKFDSLTYEGCMQMAPRT